MQNPMLSLLQGNQSQNNIMMQAVGAMMRGESPQAFMQSIAQNHPQLQGLDFSNMNQTAEQLYKQNGQDINVAKTKINQFLNGIK